jgi:Tol biopolymer transport system component
MMRTKALAALTTLVALGVGSLSVPPAGATAPGTNGRIAYSRFADAAFRSADIVSANPDGTGVVKLTNARRGVYEENPDWAPDGSKIVFQQDSDLSCGACISGIYTMNRDGSQLTRLTPDDREIYSADPAYSPDGTRIAFDRCIGCGGPDGNGGIFVMDADGTNVTQVTFDNSSTPFEEHEVQWSPDGTHFVFQRNRESDGSTAIFTAALDGSDFLRLTPWELDGEHADWSPDGSIIVFESHGNGAPSGVSTNVFTVRPDGSHLTDVTQDTGGAVNAANPAWSPDGKKIVFVQIPSGPLGYADIFTMNADGSDIRQVTMSTFWDFRPDWGTAPPS